MVWMTISVVKASSPGPESGAMARPIATTGHCAGV